MDNDFIKELGYKALDSRLKRISDRMTHDIRKLYKEIDLDVEPGWYLIFKLLQENKTLTMVEIAEQLGYSHPSIVVIVKKMAEKGYLATMKDLKDKRKQIIALTDKATQLLPKLEKIWMSCDKAIFQMLQKDLTILACLDSIDLALEESSFYKRFKTEYKKNLLS